VAVPVLAMSFFALWAGVIPWVQVTRAPPPLILLDNVPGWALSSNANSRRTMATRFQRTG
jgi:hypothetical protein